MKGISRILSVLTIITITLTQSFVFAQESSPTPTPTNAITPTVTTTLSPTQTPTPSEDPESLDETNETNELTDSNTEIIGPDPDITSDDISDIINEHIDSITTTIENNNDADVNKDVDTTNNTGENKAIENIDIFNDLVIKSGDANVQENHSNVVNTNIIGEGIVTALLNFFGDNTNNYDFSDIEPCINNSPILSSDIQLLEAEGNNIRGTDIYQRLESLGITNNNNANVVNNITVDALTGNNESLENIARTSIDTGDAGIDVNLFNMLNTNLIGECGFFGVYNFFEEETNSLILPYEKGFIENDRENALITSLDAINNNNVDADTIVDSETNTGENDLSDSLNFTRSPTIYTGDASSDKDLLDLANLSYALDNFLYLRIQHYGNWTGNLVGWDGLVFEGDDYILLTKNNQDIPEFSDNEIFVNESYVNTDVLGTNVLEDIDEVQRNVVINNNNNALLRNNLNLLADTGHNTNGNIDAEIKTGNASIDTDIFNLVNTNITGRNWFFGVVNLFESFSGDIVFPRADVAVELTSNKSQAHIDDEIEYTLTYKNIGYLPAENVSLVTVLPTQSQFISSSISGIQSGNTLIWSLGTLPKQSSGSITIKTKALNNANLLVTSVISTTSDELYTQNNSFGLSVLVSERSSQSSSNNSSDNNSSSSNSNDTQSNQDTTTVISNNVLSPYINQNVAGQFSNKFLSLDEEIDDEENPNVNNALVSNAQKRKGLFGLSGPINWIHIIIAYVAGVLSAIGGFKLRKQFS